MNKKIKEYSDYIKIAIFVIMILGYGAKVVLLSDQVKRNEAEIIELKSELKAAKLDVLYHRLGEIETKVGIIYDHIMKK